MQIGVTRTQWDAPEIDGSVMVDETIPVGEFADITIGDWRGMIWSPQGESGSGSQPCVSL